MKGQNSYIYNRRWDIWNVTEKLIWSGFEAVGEVKSQSKKVNCARPICPGHSAFSRVSSENRKRSGQSRREKTRAIPKRDKGGTLKRKLLYI